MNASRLFISAGPLLACLLASVPAAADGTSEQLDLVEPARVQALGGAAAALERDPTAVWLNPASPAGSGRTATVGGQRGFIDDQTWQMSGSLPAGPVTVAAGLAYYDSGVVTMRNADGTARRVTGQRDILGLLNASAAVGESLRAGASVKVLRSDLLDRFHATTAAVDAGLTLRPGEDLGAGVSVVNVGRRVRYETEGVALPVAVRAGASAATPIDSEGGISPDRLAGYADGIWLVRERRVEWRGGIEAFWKDSLAVRAGVSPSRGNESWRAAIGAGIFIGKLRLDYAAQLSGPSGIPQILSLTVKL